MDNNNGWLYYVNSVLNQETTTIENRYMPKPLRCHLAWLFKQWDLCTLVPWACTRTTLYGVWTEVVTGVEHLFFNQNIAFYQWILVTSILFNGQCRAWWSYFLILLVAVILQGQKSWGVYSFIGQRAISQKQNDSCSKTLCLALEYIKNCQSGVLFVALGCLDGQILVWKFTKNLTIRTCSDVLCFAAVVQSCETASWLVGLNRWQRPITYLLKKRI